LGLAVVTAPVPAAAQAVLMEARPAAGSGYAPGTIDFALMFNSRIDVARSRLTLMAPGGEEAVLPLAAVSHPAVLRSRVDLGRRGEYRVLWQVLSVNGLVSRGEYRFRVGDAGG